jgi:hypothetical protein
MKQLFTLKASSQGMNLSTPRKLAALFIASALWTAAVSAAPFTFSTGNPDGIIATSSQLDKATESADDFFLTQQTVINNATFTGLLAGGATLSNIGNIVIEIYRVFPSDSDVGRTSGPPTFSTSQVPTRVNSPADVAFDSRGATASTLTFSANVLNMAFTALNSVSPVGIHPLPNTTTGGNGSVTGQEVRFDVSFSTPFSLPAGHYFFVPQVQLSTGDFLWLSAPRPIVAPGTPFAPGVTDLQSWIRNGSLAPDWLRIGTDIVGGTPAPTFNAVFSLDGQTVDGQSVPEPGTLTLFGVGLAAFFTRRGYKKLSCKTNYIKINDF